MSTNNILIIDDEELFALALCRTLKTNGYKCKYITNPQEAIHCLEKNHPDLIILDLCMPEINGYELLNMLSSKESLNQTPVIIISAMLDDYDTNKYNLTNNTSRFYMSKPYDNKKLLKKINNMLELHPHTS